MNLRRARAFTLIELMIVITIIALLAGLVVGVGMPAVKRSMRITTTTHRAQQVLSGLELYTMGSDQVERLQRIAGFDRRLVSLREALTLLTDRHGLKLADATRGTYPLPRHGTRFVYPADGQLPPGIGVRWESAQKTGLSRQASRATWAAPETDLDGVIMFMDRVYARGTETNYLNISPTSSASPLHASNWPRLGQLVDVGNAWWLLVSWDDISRSAYGGTLPRVAGSFPPRRGRDSARGETLDGTLEIAPDAVRSPQWYLERWPNLTERAQRVAGVGTFFQRCWPDSDWDQDAPGTVPVVWHWPWGRPILSRIEGTLLAQIEYRDDGSGALAERTLAELDPLRTIALLQTAGVLPSGDEGAALYRADRSAARAWNDAWGGPLVVVNASSFPARYDFDDENDPIDLTTTGGVSFLAPKDSKSLLGGRDFLVKKSLEHHQAARFFYAAVGSPGTSWSEVLPEDWAAAEDPVRLRALWRHVREATRAHEWTGRSFADPPWQGLRRVARGKSFCFLTTPKEYR